jgi:hypothetical protein
MSGAVYVFFATGFPQRWRPLKARDLVELAQTLAIRLITRSRMTHCAVGDRCAVLDNAFGRDRGRPACVRFWPFNAFVLSFPGLVCYFEVPVDLDPDLAAAEAVGPKRVGEVLRWWLSRGRSPCSSSCVALARAALGRAGVRTPALTTPRQLHDWLAGQGYHREPLKG